MRGRTNVMQRKEPTINGLIRNFTVATGNTIAKGDFVSYKLYDENITVKSGIVFYSGQKVYDELHYRNIVKQRIENQYYLVLVDTSENYEEVAALSFGNNFYYEVSNGYVYVLDIFNRLLKVYNIVSDEFVLIDEVSLPSADYNSFGGMNIINSQGTVGIFSYKYVYQTNTQYYYPINFDGTTITMGQAITVATNIGYHGNPTECMTAYYGDNKFVIFGKAKAGTSSSTYYPRLVLCEYNNGAISVLDTTDITSYLSSYFSTLDLQIRNGLVILAGSLSTIYNGEAHLFYVNNNNSFAYITYKNLTLREESANFITDEIVNVKGYIYTWNNSSKILKLWSGTDPNSVGKGAMFLKPNSQFVGVYTDGTSLTYKFSVFVYDATEEEIALGKLTDTVESYSGNFTVGFAKTGGNAGDTIQVYVPRLSS